MRFEITIIMLFYWKDVYSANILFVGNIASPSHLIWCRSLAHALAKHGHNVTLISPDEDKVPKPENYTFMYMEGMYEELHDEFDYHEMATYTPYSMIKVFEEWAWYTCNKSLHSQALANLLNYPKEFKFDLIIFDVTIGTCFYPLLQRFNYPPAMGVTPFLLPPYISFNMGNQLYPSYIPWYCLPYSTDMTLYERFWNYFYTTLDVICRYLVEYPENDRLGRVIFGNNMADWQTLEKHITVILANTDPLLEYPQPLTPNIIPVGGLHTRPANLLPKNFVKIVEDAKNGLIVFSLGTNLRSDQLKKQDQQALLKAFSKLKETVIWKFESKLENLPKNVFIVDWLPQNDLLAQPNAKLFIGHGGALSTQEAIYHGVPILGIPFMFDQEVNIRMIVKRKLGVSLDFTKLTTDNILKTLREVLDNPIYRDNIRLTSKRFRDRPQTPLETAVFWVDYVLRHKGAHFLNSPARNMPFYASTGVDVALLFFIIGGIIIFIMYAIIKLLIRMCASNKNHKLKEN